MSIHSNVTRRSWLEAVAAAAAVAATTPAKAQTAAAGLEEVIVVYKQHFDIGYTDLARNVVGYYRTAMIDKALEIVDRTRDLPPEDRFVWTLPGWPMAQILWPGQDPERRRRVLEAYRAGLFATHGMPFTTETDFLDLETLVRGLGYSTHLAMENGKELPRDAKVTDVMCHSWVLPTMLRHAGIEFLNVGANGSMRIPDVPMLFWWEGPDGSRLLTFYSKGYGTRLVPPQGWPYKVWLAVIHTSDNEGPPKPERIQRLRDEAKANLPGVKVRIGRLSDFADAVLKTKPDLPVVRADMPDTWVHGLMSMPEDTKRGENLRPRIGSLEALGTLLKAWEAPAPARPDLATAYEQALLYGEHTWGADFTKYRPQVYGEAWRKAYAAGVYARAEESFAEHGEYNRRVEAIVGPALAGHTAALARATAVEGRRIAVFNPLPWKRAGGVVEMALPGEAPVALTDVASGESVAVELAGGGKVRFIARDVPSMGYRTYVPAARAAISGGDLMVNEKARTIGNAFFQIKLDPGRGAVASIIEKKSGRELVDGSGTYGFGQYFRELYSQEDINGFKKAFYTSGGDGDTRTDLPTSPHETMVVRAMDLEIRRGAVSVSAVMSASAGDLPHGVSVAVTLYAGLPYVELTWACQGKQKDPWPEAGWLALPFAVSNPSFRLGRLCAIADLAKDLVAGSNHELHKLANGMAVIDGESGRGVGLCPMDAPLVSIEHTGGYRYSKDFLPTRPVVFVNLYNNLYGVNFQQWISGSWSSRVRVWAVEGYEAAAGLIGPARECRVPLEAGAVEEGVAAGKLPAQQAGLELSRRGVEVTAFGPNPDGPGMILRLWEQAGADGECTVRLPAGLKVASAQPCDLRGRPKGERIAVPGDGRFAVTLRHYAPATFLLS
jgi:alpha-mannosidase